MSEQSKPAVRELTEAEMKAIKGGSGTSDTTASCTGTTYSSVVLGLRKSSGGQTAGQIY